MKEKRSKRVSSKVIDNLITEITPNFLRESHKRRIEYYQKRSVDYQLGIYIGDKIFRDDLPCLNIDMIQTNRIIEVSEEEKNKAEFLNKVWFNKTITDRNNTDKEWKELREFHLEMENKYLPEVLVCYIEILGTDNEEEVKRGIRDSLWNCDICHYDISSNEDIEITYDIDLYFSKVTLRRNKKIQSK